MSYSLIWSRPVGKVEGKLFAETSTILPETAGKLARKVQEVGEVYVAIPSE